MLGTISEMKEWTSAVTDARLYRFARLSRTRRWAMRTAARDTAGRASERAFRTCRTSSRAVNARFANGNASSAAAQPSRPSEDRAIEREDVREPVRERDAGVAVDAFASPRSARRSRGRRATLAAFR